MERIWGRKKMILGWERGNLVRKGGGVRNGGIWGEKRGFGVRKGNLGAKKGIWGGEGEIW